MSLFEDVMALAVQLPQGERERLARALGLELKPSGATSLPLHQASAQPDPVAWRKAERGHAVLATDVPANAGPLVPGPQALAGIWADRARPTCQPPGTAPAAATLPKGSPVVVHTDVCMDVAHGEPPSVKFFNSPPVEIRLATATYLALLGAASSEIEQQRVRFFVQPYAVLSLGPMASSKAVSLMFEHALACGLEPLDALIAATALAHEIPLVTCTPRIFLDVPGVTVCVP